MLKGGWWWKSCGRGLNGIYLTDPQDLTARQGTYTILSNLFSIESFSFICLFRCRDRLVPLARMGLHPQTGHDDDPTATLWQRAVDQQSSRQTYSGGIIVARPTEIYLIKKKKENGIHHRSETPPDTPTHFTTRNYSK
jgi:hypothetical protein